MRRHSGGFALARFRTSFVAMMALIALAGCSSGLTTIQTWEGDVEKAGQAALLEAPSSVKVVEVNGKRMTTYLIDDLALDYELLPGENEVVFTYKTIWARTDVVKNGESKVHVVETARQSVIFDAKAGETYQFNIIEPESRSDAEALAQNFSVDLVNSAGMKVAESSAWERSRVVAARTPVPESRAEVQNNANLPEGNEDLSETKLDKLKALWGTSSEEEKREFLRWAFE